MKHRSLISAILLPLFAVATLGAALLQLLPVGSWHRYVVGALAVSVGTTIAAWLTARNVGPPPHLAKGRPPLMFLGAGLIGVPSILLWVAIDARAELSRDVVRMHRLAELRGWESGMAASSDIASGYPPSNTCARVQVVEENISIDPTDRHGFEVTHTTIKLEGTLALPCDSGAPALYLEVGRYRPGAPPTVQAVDTRTGATVQADTLKEEAISPTQSVMLVRLSPAVDGQSDRFSVKVSFDLPGWTMADALGTMYFVPRDFGADVIERFSVSTTWPYPVQGQGHITSTWLTWSTDLPQECQETPCSRNASAVARFSVAQDGRTAVLESIPGAPPISHAVAVAYEVLRESVADPVSAAEQLRLVVLTP